MSRSPQALLDDATQHTSARIAQRVRASQGAPSRRCCSSRRLVSVFTTGGIVYTWNRVGHILPAGVIVNSSPTRTWTPLFDDQHFGTGALSGRDQLLSPSHRIPLGTVIAIYLSELAPFQVREIAKPSWTARRVPPSSTAFACCS